MKERDTGVIPVKYVSTCKEYVSMKKLIPMLIRGDRYDIGDICRETDELFGDQIDYTQDKRLIINSAAYVSSVILRFRSGELIPIVKEDKTIGYIDDYNFYAVIGKTTAHKRWFKLIKEELLTMVPSNIKRFISIKPSSNTYCLFDLNDLNNF